MVAISDSPYGDFPRSEMRRYIPQGASRVLDVGCNRGAFGAGLKQNGIGEVWGCELDPDAAAVAATRLDKVIAGPFAADTVPDHYFDVVVFNDVLEHLPDPSQILRVARDKLKPGGVVLASIPNLRHIENLLHIVRDKDFRYEPAGIRDNTHLRFFTLKSIPRLFEQAGYQIQVLEGINEEWWTPSLLRRLAFKFFPSYLSDTRFIQYAVRAVPLPAAA